MKNILITGSNGFVGNHLVKELVDSGYTVHGIGGQKGSKDTSGLLGSYVVLDLNKPEEVRKINFSGVDGIIHLAGLAAVGPSYDNPMSYLETNIGIQVNLFEEAMAQSSKPKFLIISSGALYNPKEQLPLSEISRVLPNSPYAVSKLGQEQMAEYYQTRGFECVIARPFNHIGPGQGLGFLLPDLVSQVVRVKSGKQNVVKVGNLDAKRDYTDVRDIVKAYRLLIENGLSGETYNVCTGNAVSGSQILSDILEIAGVNPEVEKDDSLFRPVDTPVLFGSHEKLTSHTGWEPTIELKTTVKNVLEDWENRP